MSVTDRQTDRPTDGRTLYGSKCLASVRWAAKNEKSLYLYWISCSNLYFV